MSEYAKLWRNKNKDKCRAASDAWAKNNLDHVRAVKRIRSVVRWKTDLQYRLKKDLRTRVRKVLRLKHQEKVGSSVGDLGCSIAELKVHLEARFYAHPDTGEQMTWENWSLFGWHIDHIKPLALFDLTDRAQFREACHFSNLQPLWAKQNLQKGAKHAPTGT